MGKNHGKHEAADITYTTSKTEEKKKQNMAARAAEEQRALVLGYDTGKSSSSDDSERQPPPIPPHGNTNKGIVPGRAKPKPLKKPMITAKIDREDDAIGAVSGDKSKINVKALAARFEKH